MADTTVAQSIFAFLGPKSIPAIVAGAVYGIFEFFDHVSSDDAKVALTRWVKDIEFRAATVLPQGTRELFQRVFGQRHFSLKCFFRSACFSIGATGLLVGLAFLYFPFLSRMSLHDMFIAHASGELSSPGVGTTEFQRNIYISFFSLWVLWSLVPDYIDLYKTRLVLNFLSKLHHPRLTLLAALIVGDLAFTSFLFYINMLLVEAASEVPLLFFYPQLRVIFEPLTLLDILQAFIVGVGHSFINLFSTQSLSMLFPVITLRSEISFSIIFYAGLMPSIWLWLYVLALFITRVALRSEPLFKRLRWFLNVEKNPFRSVGVVASGTAFIGLTVVVAATALL